MVVALRKQISLGADRGLVEVTQAAISEPQRPMLLHPRVAHEAAPTKIAKDTPAKTPKDASAKSPKDATAKTSKDSTAKTSTAKTSKDSTAKTSKDSTAKTSKDSTAKTSKDSTAKTSKDSTAKTAATASKQSYTVKSGDNLYRISKRYKIDQTVLMRANNINDPAKLNTGMTLVIPH